MPVACTQLNERIDLAVIQSYPYLAQHGAHDA